MSESFETDGLGTRYAANTFDLGSDYFRRAAATAGGLVGGNADGEYAFVGADTGADGDSAHFLEIIIDTSQAPDPQLDLKLAAVANQFEPDDLILIEAESDGDGFVLVSSFRGSGINTSLSEDTDNDGVGETA